MLTFNIETEAITVSEIGNRYIFKTYFDEDQLYKEVKNTTARTNIGSKYPKASLNR
jgi:hypothetical protein